MSNDHEYYTSAQASADPLYTPSGGSYQHEEPLYTSASSASQPVTELLYTPNGGTYQHEEPLYTSASSASQPVTELLYTPNGGTPQVEEHGHHPVSGGGSQPSEDWLVTARIDPSGTNHVIGHAFLTVQAPDGHRSDVGFYPHGHNPIANVLGAEGEMREHDTSHASGNNIGFTYHVSREAAENVLDMIKGYENSSQVYAAPGHNCTAVVSEILNAAGIPFSGAAVEPGAAAAGALLGIPTDVHGPEALYDYVFHGPSAFPQAGADVSIDALIDHLHN